MASFQFNITAVRDDTAIKTMTCPDGSVVRGTTLELCEQMVQKMRFPEYGTVVTRDSAGEILEGSPRPPLNHRLVSNVQATFDGVEYGSLAIFMPDPEDKPVYGPVMPPLMLPAAAEPIVVKRKQQSSRKSGGGRPAIFSDFPLQEPELWPADSKDDDDIPVQPLKTVRTMKTTKK